MNPTIIASSPAFHERRFCVSLFISQVLVVLVCALLLYFTLNEPSPNRYTGTDTILEISNSTDNDGYFEVEDIAIATAGAQNKTDSDPQEWNTSEITADAKDESVSECMFIQREKLPDCDKTGAGIGSSTSKKGSYESFGSKSSNSRESCNVLVHLTCNGTDFEPEDDEDGIRAAVSCTPHHISLADPETTPLGGLILRIEETNEIFSCSIVEYADLISENEAHCLSVTKNANFCLGTFLSCACVASHFTTTARVTDMALTGMTHQSTTATPDIDVDVEPETDKPGQKDFGSVLQLAPDDSLEMNSYEYESDI